MRNTLRTIVFIAASAAFSFTQAIFPTSVNNVRYVNATMNWSQLDAAGSIGNLSVAGINTLTLTPCPVGVNGTDTNLYIYISGVGTAEPAKVTTSGGAGTCTSRAATGTVKVTTLNTHGAGFTVGSSTAGGYETLKDATATNANNATIIFPPTNPPGTNFYSFYAPLIVAGGSIEISGEAGATIDCNAKEACFKTTGSASMDLHGFRVSVHTNYPGVAITNTVTAANVTTITSALNPAVGDLVDIQGTFNKHYWGPHTVVTTSATDWTFADTSATIASQATVGGNAQLNAFAEIGFGSTGAGNKIHHITVDSPGGFLGTNLNNLIVVGNDQGIHISDIVLNSAMAGCTANYCSNVIYAPGPFTPNAAVLWIDHVAASLFCNANGVTAYNGNTVSISDAVIQGFAEWSIAGGTPSGGYGNFTLSNVYNEVGACSNPNYSGSGQQVRAESGILAQGGLITVRGGEFPVGNMPRAAATGNNATQYNYYLVVHDSGIGISAPLYCAYATVDSVSPSGSITVQCPRVPGTNTITYDLLRTTGSGNGRIFPYNGGCGGGTTTACGSVLTAQAQCATTICSYTDTASVATTSYAVANPSYYPYLPFWPGGAILGPNGDTSNIVNGAGTFTTDDMTFVTNVSPLISTVTTVPRVFAHECNAGTQGVWSSCLGGTSTGNSNGSVIGTLLQQTVAVGGGTTNLKGRLNIMTSPGASLQPGHLITLVDSNAAKTLADASLRPTNDANDTYIGLDNASVSVGNAQLSIGAPIAISSYIANVGDGTSWKERLTATLKSWTVPLFASPSDNTKIPIMAQCGSGAASNLACFQVKDQSGAAILTAANDGSVALGSGTSAGIGSNTASNSDLNGTLTLSTGTQTFNFTGTYISAPICVASDTTAANPVQVQTTTTVLTITGTGSDVIYYMCLFRN